MEPTIFTNCTDDMKIVKDEIFGPVMSILKFSDTDEVIKRFTKSGLWSDLQNPEKTVALKDAEDLILR